MKKKQIAKKNWQDKKMETRELSKIKATIANGNKTSSRGLLEFLNWLVTTDELTNNERNLVESITSFESIKPHMGLIRKCAPTTGKIVEISGGLHLGEKASNKHLELRKTIAPFITERWEKCIEETTLIPSLIELHDQIKATTGKGKAATRGESTIVDKAIRHSDNLLANLSEMDKSELSNYFASKAGIELKIFLGLV